MKPFEDTIYIDSVPVIEYKSDADGKKIYAECCSDGRMVFSALVIIFLFLKRWGQVPILRYIQYVTFKYGDFQKASRISLREPFISINSIIVSYYNTAYFHPLTNMVGNSGVKRHL